MTEKLKEHLAVLTQQGAKLFTTILFLGFGMLGLGLYHLWFQNDIGLLLTTEGVAFITIGVVGIRMFLTTKDVAEGIKEEIRTSSTGIKKSIDGLATSMDDMNRNITAALTRIEKLLEDKK